MQRLAKGVDPIVFFGSVGISLAFSLWGVLATESLGAVMGPTLSWFLANFGWGFILIGAGALLLCLFFMLSRATAASASGRTTAGRSSPRSPGWR